MVIKVNKDHPTKELIRKAVGMLNSGGVLVMPTETAYGLAADATNAVAVKKIYQIKGRNFKKFLPLICSSVNQVRRYFKVGKKELEVLKRHRGLTVILKIKNQKSKIRNIYLLKGQETCAVRVSTNKAVKMLARKFGRPITATSANRSGGENCYSVGEVLGSLGNFKRPLGRSIDLILDAGKLPKRKPSTIVKVEGEKVAVVRQGEILVN